MTRRVTAIALGAGRGVAAWWPAGTRPAEARTAEFAFDAAALAAGDAASLLAPLRELRRAAGTDATALDVALASPWTSPRVVTLPPVRGHEAVAILARDHAQHFPMARAVPVIAAQPTEPVRNAPARWFVADADARLLDALRQLARDAGFVPGRVTTAVAAWAHAVGEANDRVFVVGDEAAVLHARGGRVIQLRRCRAEEAPTPVRESTDALALAARHAAASRGAEIVSSTLEADRREATTRVVRRLLAAGMAALLLTAGVQWWGARRAVALVDDARATLRVPVSAVLASRDSLLVLHDELDAVRRAERNAPEWSARLFALSAALPANAFFVALRGAGDSVEVEGRAASAAPVLDALRGVRGVVSVRATAPISVGDATSATPERFSVVVRFGAGAAR